MRRALAPSSISLFLAASLAMHTGCGADAGLVDTDDMLAAPNTSRDPNAGSSSGAPPSSSSSSSSSGSGGTASSSGESDSGPAARCDVLWALTAAEPVAGLPPTGIRPSFSADELTAYFVMPTSQYKVYAATRPSRSEPFGEALELGSNVNGGVQTLAVFARDDGLGLLFNRFDGANSQVLAVSRSAPGEAFGEAVLHRANAILEMHARDGSAGFFARNVEGGITAIFQLRPASAPEQEAVLLADGVPQWFEPESGTLWFEQYFESPAPRFYPRTAHWDGERWGDSLPTDLPIYWTSPDLCRLYGVSEAGIVMRTRVSPP